jgi:hypothetical protein
LKVNFCFLRSLIYEIREKTATRSSATASAKKSKFAIRVYSPRNLWIFLLLCEEIYSRLKKNPNEIFFIVIKKAFLMMFMNECWFFISMPSQRCSIIFQLIAAILLKDARGDFGCSGQKGASSMPFS